jgi:phosphatidylinositol-3-phosphatase
VADGKDDQIPGQAGPPGHDVPGRTGSDCAECGSPLAPDQRYCLSCGARRGRLPGAVAGTLAAAAAKGKTRLAAAGGKAPKPKGGDDGGWSWMPSPQAIAIAVIGMLALGVGLGSAMSEIADSAPLSTILLEYPHHATEAPPAEEPEEEVEEEAPAVAAAPEETAAPEEIATEPLPEENFVEPLPEESGEETPEAAPFNPFEEEEEENFLEEKPLPEVKHAFLIVLGENSYESTFGATAEAPYLTRTLPKKGELIPNYYGVTGGVLANEIALLSGQGPTPETAANCPNYTAIAPATVSLFAEQVEGNGCVYPSTVESLPTQLEAKELKWRAYVEDIEKGAEAGQSTTCRKPTLGGPDSSPAPVPGDQYATWRNPVVYFGAITESTECGKLDVGFEALTRDLKSAKKTPALSLIFPDACHSGGELECEPGAPKGAHGAVSLLKTLVPAIMASPAYEEGGLVLITSAQAPQAGEHPDPSACCLAPEYPNLPPVAATTTTTPGTSTTTEKSTSTAAESTAAGEEASTPTTTTYTEESVLPSGGGGKVGLLMISPFVEPGTVVETEYANHFTLLKTLETMFGVEPLGYAGEEEMPTLSPELFIEPEAEEGEAQKTAETSKRTASPNSATPRNLRIVGPVKRRDRRAPSWAPGRTPIESAIARLKP